MLTAKERIQDLTDGFVDDHCEECNTWCPMAMVHRWTDRFGFSAWTVHCMNCGVEWHQLDVIDAGTEDLLYDQSPEDERAWYEDDPDE